MEAARVLPPGGILTPIVYKHPELPSSHTGVWRTELATGIWRPASKLGPMVTQVTRNFLLDRSNPRYCRHGNFIYVALFKHQQTQNALLNKIII